jgi:hypothetical protein
MNNKKKKKENQKWTNSKWKSEEDPEVTKGGTGGVSRQQAWGTLPQRLQ